MQAGLIATAATAARNEVPHGAARQLLQLIELDQPQRPAAG